MKMISSYKSVPPAVILPNKRGEMSPTNELKITMYFISQKLSIWTWLSPCLKCTVGFRMKVWESGHETVAAVQGHSLQERLHSQGYPQTLGGAEQEGDDLFSWLLWQLDGKLCHEHMDS